MKRSLISAAVSFVSCALASQQPLVSSQSCVGCSCDYTSVAGTSSQLKSFTSNHGGGGKRTFRVYVPSSYQLGKPMGLVISYHGRGKDAVSQEALSQFSNEQYNKQYIAVYPDGVRDQDNQRSWTGPDYHPLSISNDTQFTHDLLTYMNNNYCIDQSQIYATGKSNGGGFVGTLACDKYVGSNFAAFAAASGAFYTDVTGPSDCTPARVPTPILEFHGFKDGVIPYLGGEGEGGPTPAIPDWLSWWATRNGCDVGDSASHNNTAYFNTFTKRDTWVYNATWKCGFDQPVVQGYNISDMGHAWPSESENEDNKPKPGHSNVFAHPTVIEATDIMMKFFQSHVKPKLAV